MKAKETTFLRLLDGTCQYTIPIYQRTYDWQIVQCEQLWHDIVKVAMNEKSLGHFIGSVIYIQKGIYQHSTVPQSLVIDGQQRLTTISILLSALSHHLGKQKNDSDITKEKIDAYYLFNIVETGDLKHKLVLTQSDKATLFSLLEGKAPQPPISKNIVDNFNFFKQRIETSKLDPQLIYKGISKLIVVDIALDREHDSPQHIFESMNYNGLPLTQADLIRNYILMELDPKDQESLYNDYWYPMEQSFGQTDYKEQFDRFMRDYLTLKTGSIPKLEEVYATFKSYAPENKLEVIRGIVSEIFKFSKYFVKMALEKEEDPEISSVIKDINCLKVDVAYPFLLEAYDDYTNGKISKDELVQIMRLIESYVFRRSICAIPTNSLNKTFATLSKEIDKTRYLESFSAVLQLKDSYRKYPDDVEFVNQFIVRDIYGTRNDAYILNKLENFDRKEMVNLADYTIEHIMPQNPNFPNAWKQELGDNWEVIREKYLHKIGNLTLTGYNPELSDSPFLEKRNMKGGFADSPLRLNRDLARLEHWTDVEIQQRAENLAKLACQVWAYTNLSSDVLAKYRKEKKPVGENIYTLQDHPYLEDETGKLFEHLRKHLLNLDASVKEEILKLYIAYKTSTNFVDIVPQKNRLRLSLNMKFNEIHDPKRMCVDVTNKGRWGNGDVEVYMTSIDQIEDVMALIRQSFDKHEEE